MINLNTILYYNKTIVNRVNNNTLYIISSNISRRNIINIQNSTYLKSCTYNSSDEVDRLCPIFTLDTIVREAGQNFDEIALKVITLILPLPY